MAKQIPVWVSFTFLLKHWNFPSDNLTDFDDITCCISSWHIPFDFRSSYLCLYCCSTITKKETSTWISWLYFKVRLLPYTLFLLLLHQANIIYPRNLPLFSVLAKISKKKGQNILSIKYTVLPFKDHLF